jgi:hypothetical protein
LVYDFKVSAFYQQSLCHWPEPAILTFEKGIQGSAMAKQLAFCRVSGNDYRKTCQTRKSIGGYYFL